MQPLPWNLPPLFHLKIKLSIFSIQTDLEFIIYFLG